MGVGVATWAMRDGRLCLGELAPGAAGGRGRESVLEAGRTLALLPGEAVLQARLLGLLTVCFWHACGSSPLRVPGLDKVFREGDSVRSTHAAMHAVCQGLLTRQCLGDRAICLWHTARCSQEFKLL